ncbi:CBS domain-containing protein [Mesobacillus maritimus]|uniref:CBS domain-containing protein n=1 Tax=Mesobacillus maritimus TaxID=1643336 RepID=UPI00203BFDDC|nr:CBS domain-containing protein [Mesobacillus maritimus]MCM3586644.1 CBS domain-containing protein [Mesobacillus maritimus]MCM3668603.1 CBS domain-containing protein [Mesobacillus maritimus]
MFVRNVYVEKHKVTFCPSSYTTREALDLLRKTGFRCIPVVDTEKNQYKGQIYKVHLLEHLYENGGKSEDSVLKVVKEKDSSISRDSSLSLALLRIDRLPFLAVTNDDGEFLGIITHSVLMDLFRDGFGMKTGGYCFTVSIWEQTGAFLKLLKLLKSFNIEGAHTFGNGNELVRRLTFTIAEDNEEVILKLKERIEKAGFRVLHVEKIEHDHKAVVVNIRE